MNAVAVGALPDGTPVIVSGGDDGTVRVWRLADGTPVGEPLMRRPRRRGGRGGGRALPDGTPVIVSGGDDHGVRVWRLADGTPVGEPLHRPRGAVSAVAVGALPDGTPVIVSGGGDGTVRVWRLADGSPVGEPLTGHTGGVSAVAVGALPDGTPVIVSGGEDGTVRVWRLADGTPVVPPLDLSEPVGCSPFTATSSSLRPGPTSPSTNQRSRDPYESCSMPCGHDRPTERSDNGRLSGTTRAPASDHVGGGPPPVARLGHVIRYIC